MPRRSEERTEVTFHIAEGDMHVDTHGLARKLENFSFNQGKGNLRRIARLRRIHVPMGHQIEGLRNHDVVNGHACSEPTIQRNRDYGKRNGEFCKPEVAVR